MVVGAVTVVVTGAFAVVVVTVTTVVGGRVFVVVELVLTETAVVEVAGFDVVLVATMCVVDVVVTCVVDVVVVGAMRVVDVVVVVGLGVVAVVVVAPLSVVDVVVPVDPVTITMQPVPVAGVIVLPLVSNRLRTTRPMGVCVLEAPTTLKVTIATLTTPVGPVRLALWKPEILVSQLVPVQMFLLLVGVPENSEVLPPATESTVKTEPS